MSANLKIILILDIFHRIIIIFFQHIFIIVTLSFFHSLSLLLFLIIIIN